MKPAKISIALLVIQLAIVSSIAAKYLYQRWTCPRVWTRTVVFDPDMLMRGRYLSLQLYVDTCGQPLPDKASDSDGASTSAFRTSRGQWDQARAIQSTLIAKDGRLAASELKVPEGSRSPTLLQFRPGATCSDAILETPVDFYIPEHADVPFGSAPGKELWIEVTVPPKGPPRPLQLAQKIDGVWKPIKVN